MWTNVMMAICELIPADYGIYDAYMICILICIHDIHMDFRIWRNIGLVCYGTVLIVYCVTRYNDDKLVWFWYDVCYMFLWWFVVYLCICLMFYVCWNVMFECCIYCTYWIYLYVLLYCCNTITLHCMIYIV